MTRKSRGLLQLMSFSLFVNTVNYEVLLQKVLCLHDAFAPRPSACLSVRHISALISTTESCRKFKFGGMHEYYSPPW